MSGPREDAYDAEVAPLMAQIIAICKARKIPMAATFELDRAEGNAVDDPLMCSTVLGGPGWEHNKGRVLRDVVRVINRAVGGSSSIAMITVRNAAGEVAAMDAVVVGDNE